MTFEHGLSSPYELWQLRIVGWMAQKPSGKCSLLVLWRQTPPVRAKLTIISFPCCSKSAVRYLLSNAVISQLQYYMTFLFCYLISDDFYIFCIKHFLQRQMFVLPTALPIDPVLVLSRTVCSAVWWPWWEWPGSLCADLKLHSPKGNSVLL